MINEHNSEVQLAEVIINRKVRDIQERDGRPIDPVLIDIWK